MAKKQRIRIELPLNPQSSALDAMLWAKLNACLVPPTHLLRVLLMNHFALQPGGLGLTEEEQAAFIELSPRFGRKTPSVKTAAPSPVASSRKYADVAPKESVLENKINEDNKPRPADGSPGSGKKPWGPDNLPPCFDMSDFGDFGTQPGQIVNGKDYL